MGGLEISKEATVEDLKMMILTLPAVSHMIVIISGCESHDYTLALHLQVRVVLYLLSECVQQYMAMHMMRLALCCREY